MNNYYPYNDELYHHGVKGMKWGVLRSRTAVLYDKNPGHKAESKNSSSNNPYEGEVYKKRTEYARAKQAYKSANKHYNKAFNDSLKYDRRHPIGIHVLKNEKRDKAIELEKKLVKSAYYSDNKRKAMQNAKSAYKQAKKDNKAEYKQLKKTEKADAKAKKREYWLEEGRKAAAERDAARARKLSKKNGSDATQAKIKRSKNKSLGYKLATPLSAIGSGVATVGSATRTGQRKVIRDSKRAIKRIRK